MTHIEYEALLAIAKDILRMSVAVMEATERIEEKVSPPSVDAVLRAEFWALRSDGLVDRRTIAAVLYLSKQSLEIFATKGGGPKYTRLGRRSYYRKSDVLAWIDKNGQLIEATAQYKAQKEGDEDG